MWERQTREAARHYGDCVRFVLAVLASAPPHHILHQARPSTPQAGPPSLPTQAGSTRISSCKDRALLLNAMAPVQADVDYYAVLQIENTATLEVITRSYRQLALVYHPDKNLDNHSSTAAFQKVCPILCEPICRSRGL